MTPFLPNDPRFGASSGPNGVPAGPAVPGTPMPPVAPPPPIVTAPPNGPALLKALRRRWPLAAVASILGSGAVAAALFFLIPPSKHAVQAQFELIAAPTGALGKTSPDATNAAMFRTAQAIKLKSKLVIDAALRDPKVAGLGILKDVQDPVSWANRELRITSPGGADEFLMISLQTDYPEDGRLLLDAVTRAYMAEFINTETELRNNRYEALKGLKDRYDAEEKKRREFMQQWSKNVGSNVEVVAQQQTMLQKQIMFYSDNLMQLDRDIAQHKIEVKSMKERDPTKLPLDDQTFMDAGKVGVWTKADSVTLFDDFLFSSK